MPTYRCQNKWGGCPSPAQLFDASELGNEYCSQECRRIAHARLLGISIPHVEAPDNRPAVQALMADRAAKRKTLSYNEALLALSKAKHEVKSAPITSDPNEEALTRLMQIRAGINPGNRK